MAVKNTIRFLISVCVLSLISLPVLAQSRQDVPKIEILEFVLAEDVIEREPVNIRQTFSADDRQAFCFARINNPNEMINLEFRWFFEEELYFTLPVKIGQSKSWRTYSSVQPQPGAWRVELTTSEGQILKEIRFHVAEPE